MHDNKMKDLEDTSYQKYKADLRELQKRQRNQAKNHLKHFASGAHEIQEINERERQREINSLQRMKNEYQESEKRLHKFNRKLEAVNNRLHENFQKRIESLNTSNTRTNEIKVKMAELAEENSKVRFASFYQKQLEHLKRMKKKEIQKSREQKKLVYKHLEKQNQVRINKKAKENEFEELKDKVKPTYYHTHMSQSVDSKFRESFMKKRQHLQSMEQAHKFELIQKMHNKIKRKEAIQKKKEDIMHFALLKQKEML